MKHAISAVHFPWCALPSFNLSARDAAPVRGEGQRLRVKRRERKKARDTCLQCCRCCVEEDRPEGSLANPRTEHALNQSRLHTVHDKVVKTMCLTQMGTLFGKARIWQAGCATEEHVGGENQKSAFSQAPVRSYHLQR